MMQRVYANDLFSLPDVASFKNFIREHHVDVSKWRCPETTFGLISSLCWFRDDRSDILEYLLDDLQQEWTSLALYRAVFSGNMKCMLVLLKFQVEDMEEILAIALDFTLMHKRNLFARILLDHGAGLHRVRPWRVVPRSIKQFADGRDRARRVALVLVGVRSKRVDRNVARIIGQWVWATRGATDEWGVIRKRK
jgi:hypothetical protein